MVANVTKSIQRGQSPGYTSMTVLIFIGFISMAGVATLNRTIDVQSEASYRAQTTEVSITGQILGQGIDCQTTFANANCTGSTVGKVIALWGRDENGKSMEILSATDATKNRFGHMTARAERGSNSGFLVKAARLTSSGTLTSTEDTAFAINQFTKKRYKWTDKTIEELCGNNGTFDCSGGGTFCPGDDYESQLKIITADVKKYKADGTACGSGGGSSGGKYFEHYCATAVCPTGYSALSYGVNCGDSGGLLGKEAIGSNGWYVDCSAYKSIINGLVVMCAKLP